MSNNNIAVCRLTGERGIPILPKTFEKLKFKGKGHEVNYRKDFSANIEGSLSIIKHQHMKSELYYIQSNEIQKNIMHIFKKDVFHSLENIKS